MRFLSTPPAWIAGINVRRPESKTSIFLYDTLFATASLYMARASVEITDASASAPGTVKSKVAANYACGNTVATQEAIYSFAVLHHSTSCIQEYSNVVLPGLYLATSFVYTFLPV